MNKYWKYLGVCVLIIALHACKDTDDEPTYTPTPVTLGVPEVFQGKLLPPVIPEDNPLTEEGIALGKKLFFDPILSGNGTQACADCHRPEHAFSDPRQFSLGINGNPGTRHSMPLFNIAWNFENKFFWDGRALGLEAQIFDPVVDPNEMANTWPNAESTLQADAEYPELFEQAFGTSRIDSVNVSKAIAQFLRTLVSANSKFDRFQLGLAELTPEEENGLNVFLDEGRGDCFHCHGLPANPLWTDNIFHNNGMDEIITDLGLGGFSGDPREFGHFKSPSLRNLAYTAPFMHDGRFATIEEVINHYSEGLVFSETIDPLMKNVSTGGAHMTESDKADLKAFLLTLSDESFINNPDFRQ
ncbi:cytochrome c peroxidase [Aureisphaera galaxeae]|uniref:cytochrome-c peroxidase n=1 Tax=Aureisphaera galaxeae TaxID=1538023 RepID=UPI00234FCACA|nr:cytochrome c peroxidase [Aureisphaera galaxeae]MDC8002612.1 cytochrome c peroxidase [Aureisphaera galaxeae]